MNVKDLTMKLNVCIALILSAYGLAVAQSETFQVVEPEKIPEILRTIANQTKANFGQIHTWQGELEFSRYSIDRGENAKSTFEIMTDAVGPSPNEVAELTENTVIFKCDLDKELFYSKRSREAPSRYFDSADGRDLGTKSIPSCSSQIVTKKYRYSAEPVAMREEVVVERKAVKDRMDADCPSCNKGRQPVYLPTYIFDIDSQVWERYSDFVNIIKEKGEYVFDGLALKVEQRTLSGDVQYRVHEPFKLSGFVIINGWLINTFSANAGYNIISAERISADGKLMQRKSMEYQKVNSVYVPIRDTEDNYDFKRDFSLRVHTETVFKNVRINDAIPAETFTYKNLGLKDGDKFNDKIEGKEYRYQDANLVPITSADK